MKAILVFFALFLSTTFLQPCRSPAQVVDCSRVNTPGEPDNSLWIECFHAEPCDVACPADPCVRWRIINKYMSVPIKSYSFHCEGHQKGEAYEICAAVNSTTGVNWNSTPHGCALADGSGSEDGVITCPPGNEQNYNESFDLTLCGGCPGKCFLTIYFDDPNNDFCTYDLKALVDADGNPLNCCDK